MSGQSGIAGPFVHEHASHTRPHFFTAYPIDRLTGELAMESIDAVGKVIVALSTCPDEETARSIAQSLVQEGLATCVNRVGGVHSTYFWDGRLQEEGEILLIMKTCESRLTDLEARLKVLHPYEVPELIVLPVIGGNEAYLQWVRQGVSKEDRK